MISETKLIYHLNSLEGERKPITADLFLTTYCNNKCGFCVYGRWDHEQNRYMDAGTFKRVLWRLKELGAKAVILTGGGEPCINPDFDEIVQCLDEDGFEYGINSNFLKYRDCNPVWLKVSLDAWDEESYRKIRGVDGYKKVRENIIRFKENHPNTNLGIQQIGITVENVRRFYDGNRDLPVDYIVVRPIESTCGEFYRDGYKGAEAVVDCVRGIAKNDSRVKLNYKFNYLKTGFTECVAHWAQIAVDVNANVIYCCHKPYEIVGSLFDADILEKHRRAVTDMGKCDIPCRMTAPNLACQIPRDVNFI